MVSTKFYCGYDEYIYLSKWAEYGNIDVDELKELELDFLDALVRKPITLLSPLFIQFSLQLFSLKFTGLEWICIGP